MKRRCIVLILFTLFILTLQAQDPEVRSKSAILLDAVTGTVLFEKNADEPIPPASLTKLVTMHLAFRDVAMGKVHLDDVVPIPKAAWAINQSWGSSLMFLGPGQQVTLRELLLGLSVCSGNDAAIAIALYLAPTIEDFADRMNLEVRRLGLEHTHFMEPSGISEHNYTTAREFAAFCRYYISQHPDALRDFHSVREFAYPKAENVAEAYKDNPQTIVQTNRNLLLDAIEGVDGLKTGYIIESGYNIALTAQRNGTRFLAVLLGGPGSSTLHGGQIRAEDGAKLIEWGFENYKTLEVALNPLPEPRIWKGSINRAHIKIAGQNDSLNNQYEPEHSIQLLFTIEKDRGSDIQQKIQLFEPLIAPIESGTIIGQLVLTDSSGTLQQVPLTVQESIPQGNIFKRAFDSILLALTSFLRNLGIAN